MKITLYQIALLATLVAGALAPRNAAAYIADDRWGRTATNSSTGSMGTPVTLTWSFAPDGTLIPGATDTTPVASNLRTFLDTNWGAGSGGSDLTQRPWFPIFSQAFARISEISGVTYVYEPNDNGVAFGNGTSARGVLGTRGDVRLSGKSYGSGSNTLASNYYPDYGDMMINTDQSSYFLNSSNNYRAFRNTLMHEAMHGLGISHVDSSNAGFLIEPYLSTAFDGPQLDDLLAIQRLYGDAAEKNGGNDVYSRALAMGSLSTAASLTQGTAITSTIIPGSSVGYLSIDDDSDTDFFSFTVPERLDVTLNLTPQGASYQVGPEGGTQTTLDTLALSNLSLALYGVNGTTQLVSADANAAGQGESITRRLMPGTYYARVKGASDAIQLYQLGITAAVPNASSLVWTGSVDYEWSQGGPTNFVEGASAASFFAGDHVTFDDSTLIHSVTIVGNVAPAEMTINTSGHYLFAGGGITAGSVTIAGPGTVELANSGNTYTGATVVQAGTLAITGNANAMQSPISVAAGAVLLMNASDAATMASSFTIAEGGTLQIGTATSTTNVFPDAPTAVVNEGTIRVWTTESLQAVAGGGQIVVESGVTTLDANPLFVGALTVRPAAIALAHTAAGLGGATTTAHVESQGTLRLAGNEEFSQSFALDADSTLALEESASLGVSALLSGNGSVTGSALVSGTISPGSAAESSGTLSFTDDLTLAARSRLNFRLGGTEAAIDFASLEVAGTAQLAGVLAVSLIDDFAPTHGDSFTLLLATAGLSGNFNDWSLPLLADNLTWEIDYEPNAVVLHVAAPVVHLAGDFNLDGFVDAADYTVWRDGLGEIYTEADFELWKANFGQSTGGGGELAATTAVPEPSAWLLLVAGAIGAWIMPLQAGRTK